MKLIFIGERFYRESGTMMSSIYSENGQRSNWGHVQLVLEGGEPVEIRPATQEELTKYEAKLKKWNENNGL